jgi:hypothetical protein
MPLQHNTWDELFRSLQTEEGPLKDLAEANAESSNSSTMGHLSNPTSLRESVVANSFNFFLIPGKGKNIQLIHSAILVQQDRYDPVIVGIQGNRSTSPFREIPANVDMTRAVRTGRSTASSNTRWTPPSIDQFLQITSGKEFEELKSKPGDDLPMVDFRKLPNHLLTHAFVFHALEGKGVMSASGAGMKVIARMEELLSGANASQRDRDRQIYTVTPPHDLIPLGNEQGTHYTC